MFTTLLLFFKIKLFSVFQYKYAVSFYNERQRFACMKRWGLRTLSLSSDTNADARKNTDLTT